MEKKELMNELEKHMKDDGTVLWYGTSGIANDLKTFLKENETIVMVAGGNLLSPDSFLKPTKMFREYLVLTNTRMICMECGIRTMGVVFPFLNKKKGIYYKDIRGISIKRIENKLMRLFYDSILSLETAEKEYKICIKSKDMAEKMKNKILELSETQNVTDIGINAQETENNAKKSSEAEPAERKCSKCGFVLEEDMVFCPNCGNNMTEKKTKKKGKKKWVVIAAIILAVGIYICNIDMNAKLKYEPWTSTSSEYFSFAGIADGYAEWEYMGFEGTAQLDITVPYPVKVPDHDFYAVYMNAARTKIGLLQQPKKEKLKDWDWLNQVTEEPYEGCIHAIADLRMIGYQLREDDTELPVFEIRNVILY